MKAASRLKRSTSLEHMWRWENSPIRYTRVGIDGVAEELPAIIGQATVVNDNFQQLPTDGITVPGGARGLAAETQVRRCISEAREV